MKKESLERGQKIISDLARIKRNLEELRDKDINGVTYYDEGVTPKLKEEIRQKLIRSHVNARRRLQREFNNL